MHDLRRLDAPSHRMESGCGDCYASETPEIPVTGLEIEGEDDQARLRVYILHHVLLLLLLSLLCFPFACHWCS